MPARATTLLRPAALAALAALLLAPGCGKKAAPDVLATVGTQTITVADFQAEIQRRAANRQPLPERATLLEEMVARAALVERAKAAGCATAADVRRTIEDVLIAKLKETELEPQLAAVKVSPEEIRTAYERDAARFTAPAKAQLAFLFIAADPKTDTNHLAELTARITEAQRQAQALPATEKSFGAVAADFSEDQLTRYRGGDGGWFTPDLLAARWPQEVVTAGLNLKNTGDLTGILRAKDGFYLVKKMDARPAVVTPLAQAQGALERQLRAAKLAQAETAFRTSLRATVPVQTQPQLLSQIAYPTQNLATAVPAVPPALPSSP